MHIACLLLDRRHPSREASMCRPTDLAVLTFCLTTILLSGRLVARDDGRFANSPLKPWFDRLASGKGLCCSFADGFSVQDVDWDTQDGHYRVRIYGQWLDVPDDAVVTPLCGPITTATATRKFGASCLVPARSPHLTAAMSERTWRSARGTQRIFPSTQGDRWVLSPLTSDRLEAISVPS